MGSICLYNQDNKILARISGSNPQILKDALDTHCGDGGSNGAVNGGAADTGAGAAGLSGSTASTQPVEEEDLNKRLEKLVKAAPVMLFMKGTPSAPQCGFSRQLVGILRDHNVRYGFFNILADEDVRSGLKEFADWPTFPMLWVDGEFVGGLDVIKDMVETGQFEEVVSAVAD